jgi:rSAM/selenodomain-associated transferase 1
MSRDTAIIVFVKNPKKGTVKTRLAKDIGEEQALQIYLKLIDYTKAVLDQTNMHKVVAFSSELMNEQVWNGFQQTIQRGSDLGAKLACAFQDYLQDFDKVVIIGSDCAEITSGHLLEASRKLNDQDVVLGPAKDGGYYLIGMRRFVPQLFVDMPWSSPNLLEMSLEKLELLSISYALLEELSDVDYLSDWEKVEWR